MLGWLIFFSSWISELILFCSSVVRRKCTQGEPGEADHIPSDLAAGVVVDSLVYAFIRSCSQAFFELQLGEEYAAKSAFGGSLDNLVGRRRLILSTLREIAVLH